MESAQKKHEHVIGIFIDLSKAFDTIDHEMLLHKLNHYGIRGSAHSLLKSYLTDRMQYTTVLNESSNYNKIKYGVPQGSVLGPLLFIIYINDIVNCTTKAHFVLFADDTNIFVVDKSEKEAYEKVAKPVYPCSARAARLLGRTRAQVYACLGNEKAYKVLNSVNTFMKLNKLHINKSKCYFIHFKPRKRAHTSKNSNDNESESENTFVLKIAGEDIKKVSETKFLGITIEEKLSWDGQIKNVKRKLNFATASLNRIKNNLPEHMHKDLYRTLFEPHLTYCIYISLG